MRPCHYALRGKSPLSSFSSPISVKHFSLSQALASPRVCTSLCALTIGSRACSTTTSSTAQQQHAHLTGDAKSARRRSKRFSYADADRVYGVEVNIETQTTGADKNSIGDVEATFSPPQPPPPHQQFSTCHRASEQHQPGPRSLFATLQLFHIRLQQRWLRLIFTLLRRPYVGPAVVRVFEASAYAAYVKGSVTLFTRRSVSPPITAMPETSVASRTDGVEPSPAPQRIGRTNHSTVAKSTVAASTGSDVLQGRALDCIYIGQSPIHSRGLFTRQALRKGTRIIAEPHRSLLLAPHFLKLLADTHEKLPDTWHYTQPTGSVVELVTQAQPHHLMNHSCRANVCSGLSHAFWGPALLACAQGKQAKRQAQETNLNTLSPPRGEDSDNYCGSNNRFPGTLGAVKEGEEDADASLSLQERLAQWPSFADANSFFLTRDVAAGEELTLDYSTRQAPFSAAATAAQHGLQAQSWLLCRCGEPSCRHYVYRHRAEVTAYLHQLRTAKKQKQRVQASAGEKGESIVDAHDPVRIAATLLALGFDDELALLSYAARPADVVAYVFGEPMPSFCGGEKLDGGSRSAASVELGIDTEWRRISKRDLLMSYRYVFRTLNEAIPTETSYRDF